MLAEITYRKSQVLEMPLDVTPDHGNVRYSMGRALLEQGGLDNAIAAFRKQLEINPDHEHARNNLGNAFYRQGKLDEPPNR
jgi:tetratricopeptide (TPR) repeat protein